MTYDADSPVELHVVRVDGRLEWATNRDTTMVVETLVGGPSSTISIGRAGDPVRADVEARVIVAGGERIDLRADPERLGHGIVSLGELSVRGAVKTPYSATQGEDLMAGATSARLADVSGWRVGDAIEIVGVDVDDVPGVSGKGTLPGGRVASENERRVVTDIDRDGTVTWDEPLIYDHDVPQDLGFHVYLANLTRNVTFQSATPDGVRGHVMAMGEADIRYAAMREMGRFDAALGRTDHDTRHLAPENGVGRYPIHLHELGVGEGAEMATVVGNVVDGSPGWGIVHHDSHAAVDWNVVTAVKGAGIVSEKGNETGQWIGNLSTNIYGDGDPFNHVRDELHGDFGHSGVAYESQSRMVVQQDNIAASAHLGWSFQADERWGGRDADVHEGFDSDGDGVFDYTKQGADVGVENVRFNPSPFAAWMVPDDPAVSAFVGNAAYRIKIALVTGHRDNVREQTDTRSQFIDFDVLNSGTAFNASNYAFQYVVKDSVFANSHLAVHLEGKHHGTTLNNVDIVGATYGIRNLSWNHNGALIDVTMKDVHTPFENTGRVDNAGVLQSQVMSSRDLSNRRTIEVDWARGADLAVTKKSSDHTLRLEGTITDSVGSYGMAEQRWITNVHYGETIVLGRDGMDTLPNLLARYGALDDGDGTYTMPVPYWITDRATAEHHAHRLDIDVRGFTASEMAPYLIDAYEAPSGEVTVIDTLAQNGAPRPVPADPTPTPAPKPDPTPDPKPDPKPAPGPAPTPDPEPDPSGPGRAIQLDGRSAVEIDPLSLKGAFTIEAWVRPSDGERIDNLDGLVRSLEGGDRQDLNFHAGKLRLYSEGRDHVVADTKAQAGVWTHYAITRDGGGGLRLYVDGELDATGRFGGDLDVEAIGGSVRGVLHGQMDELRIWDVARSGSQIARDMDAALGEGVAGLERLYSFDDADGFDLPSGARLVASSAPLASGSGPIPAPAPAPEPAPDEGSTLLSYDRLELRGGATRPVNLAHDEDWEVEAATIDLSFAANKVNGVRGLFSRDARGAGEGDVAAWIANGVLKVAFEHDGARREFSTAVEAGRAYDLELGFGEGGVRAVLDGRTVGEARGFHVTWLDNREFLQIGGVGGHSARGEDDVRGLFDGVIEDFAITEGFDGLA